MKLICGSFLLIALFVLSVHTQIALWARAQSSPLSLPLYTPIHCSKQTGCVLLNVQGGRTGIIVARNASPQAAVTDFLGNTWTNDQCVPFGGDCIFHAVFADNPNHYSDQITFVGANDFTDVYMFVYAGVWNFDSGAYGTYAAQNYPFSECTNGQDCPYNWTVPVDAEAGSLLIGFADANSTGPGIPQAGMGYVIEASDGKLAIEDMIAPVSGVYIGALYWRATDGSFVGGSHWVMGLAEYRRK